jgi:hypothetical protein
VAQAAQKLGATVRAKLWKGKSGHPGSQHVQTTLVACPGNHLYRTTIIVIQSRPSKGSFFLGGTGRALRHRHHRSDLAHECDLDTAALARANGDLLDQPPQDHEGLGPAVLAVQGVVQRGDLGPVELGQVQVQPDRSRRRCCERLGELRLLTVERVQAGLQAREDQSVDNGGDQPIELCFSTSISRA